VQLLAIGRFPQISAVFGRLSEKQSAALFASTDERFELGLAAILDRFDRPRPRAGPLAEPVGEPTALREG
jgi:hypothetical protein